MSRLAYLGPACPARAWLIDSPRSLLTQSRMPRSTDACMPAPDGFGLGWIDARGQGYHYRSEQAIWRDPNLDMLAHAIHAPVWLGAVHSTRSDRRTVLADLQPFIMTSPRDPARQEDLTTASHDSNRRNEIRTDATLLFSHDGFIDRFDRPLRQELGGRLTAKEEDRLQGSGASAWLHAWWRVLWAESGANSDGSRPLIARVEDTLARLLWEIDVWLDDRAAMLNVTLACPDGIVAARHAIHQDAAALYFCTDDERFPEGAQLVASEPVTTAETWHIVPPHHLLLIRPERPPELHLI